MAQILPIRFQEHIQVSKMQFSCDVVTKHAPVTVKSALQLLKFPQVLMSDQNMLQSSPDFAALYHFGVVINKNYEMWCIVLGPDFGHL